MARLRTIPVAVRVIAAGASLAGTDRVLVVFLPGVHGLWARIGLVAVGIVLAAPAILWCVGIVALYCCGSAHPRTPSSSGGRPGGSRCSCWCSPCSSPPRWCGTGM